MPRVAAYGNWSSPLTIERVLAATRGLSDVALDAADVLWLETPPGQNGRQTVMRLHDGELVELTPAPLCVRSRVNEYGGGAWSAREGQLVVCDDAAGRLWHRTPDGPLRPLTPESTALRFGDLRLHPDRGLVLAVREDHRGSGEAVTTIVALRLDSDNDDGGQVLCQGADFYADPELRPDGAFAWVEWNHPAMPWDASRLMAGRLIGDLVVGAYPLTSGTTSVQHPRWTPTGDLTAMDDASGFWNLIAGPPPVLRALHPMDADCDLPAWTLGRAAYAVADARTAVIAWWQDARVRLGWLDLMNGSLAPVDLDVSSVDSVAADAHAAYAVVGHPDRGSELVRLPRPGTPDAGRVHVLRRAMDADPDPATLSVPQSIVVHGRFGPVQAWFYAPVNAGFEPPAGERPPAIVVSHGGPTAFATADYNSRTQFWTSRGYGIVDVNYSGSAGFGRAYRDRLKGQWGIADVSDCEDVVRELIRRGLIDPARVAISGGSAGGYTTLQALVDSDLFAAGISSYGIGDLAALARDTHKFESRYLDGLVAPWPGREDTYRERSPIHHLDRLHTPMLILQGREDRVVPPEQALAMADAVRSRGLPVQLVMFDGEGHGFRGEAAKAASLQAQLQFLTTLFATEGDD